MKFLKVLYIQVIIGIIAGVFAGWLFPSFSPTAKLISDTLASAPTDLNSDRPLTGKI